MRTKLGQEFSAATASDAGGEDPMVDYLWSIDLNGSSDEASGTVEAPTGYFARIGRRMVRSDERGNLSAQRFATVEAATEEFANLAAEFDDWGCDATCTGCGTHFASEEGSCWCCGERSWSERIR